MRILTVLMILGFMGCGHKVVNPPTEVPLPPVTEPAPTPAPVPVPLPQPEPEPVYTGKVVKMGIDAQTLDQAYALVKAAGKGAILFERGKTYSGNFTAKHTIQDLTLDAYGIGAEPVIKTGGGRLLFKETKNTLGKLTIHHLRVDKEGAKGEWLRWLDGGTLDIQNNFADGQITIQQYAGEGARNVVIKNNVLKDSWNIGAVTGGTHAQCIYAQGVTGLTIEGNSFSMCGWKKQAVVPGKGVNDEATIYNHSMYLSSCNDVVVRENHVDDSSSMGLKMRSDVAGHSKNILIENNYFKNGEIGVGIGGNIEGSLEFRVPDRFENVKILNNTFDAIGSQRPTNRYLAWGIELDGDTNVTIAGNKFVNWPTFSNSFWVKKYLKSTKNVSIDMPVKKVQKIDEGGVMVPFAEIY